MVAGVEGEIAGRLDPARRAARCGGALDRGEGVVEGRKGVGSAQGEHSLGGPVELAWDQATEVAGPGVEASLLL